MSDYEEWDPNGARQLRRLLTAPDAAEMGYDFSMISQRDERQVTNENREDFVLGKIEHDLFGCRLDALRVSGCRSGSDGTRARSLPLSLFVPLRHPVHHTALLCTFAARPFKTGSWPWTLACDSSSR